MPTIEPGTKERLDQWMAEFQVISDADIEETSIFQGLNDADISKLLRKSYIINCHRGDKIILEGKYDRSMFLIMQGSVDVMYQGRVVTTLKEGDVIGELAFLRQRRRSADVVAASAHVQVLSLNEKSLRRMMDNEPRIAAQLMLNLAKIVSVKLITQQLQNQA